MTYRAGVGAVAKLSGRRAAGGGLVRIAGIVIVARIKRWHRSGSVIVEDQSVAGGQVDLREVNDYICTLGRSQV
jgi:hypothetical protein